MNDVPRRANLRLDNQHLRGTQGWPLTLVVHTWGEDRLDDLRSGTAGDLVPAPSRPSPDGRPRHPPTTSADASRGPAMTPPPSDSVACTAVGCHRTEGCRWVDCELGGAELLCRYHAKHHLGVSS